MNNERGILAASRFALVALCLAAAALSLTLAGCGGVDKSLYTGSWSLESGSDESLDADSLALLRSLGLEVLLTLNDDETGQLDQFGETLSVTWKASSNSEGEMTIDGSESTFTLADGKLTVTDTGGTVMVFVRAADAGTAPAAASSAAATSASAESASAQAADAEAGDQDAEGEDTDADADGATGEGAAEETDGDDYYAEEGDDADYAEGEGDEA